MRRESVVTYTDPVDQSVNYTICFSIPLSDLQRIQSIEEMHGWVISKVEALLNKGTGND